MCLNDSYETLRVRSLITSEINWELLLVKIISSTYNNTVVPNEDGLTNKNRYACDALKPKPGKKLVNLSFQGLGALLNHMVTFEVCKKKKKKMND